MYAEDAPTVSDIDSEEVLISALMIDSKLWDILPALREDDFYSSDCRIVYAACCALRSQGKQADLTGVKFFLRTQGKFERSDFINRLANAPLSAIGYSGAAAKRVRELGQRRKAISVLHKALEYMQDANKSYSNILDRMNKKFHEIELIENRDLIPLTKAKQRLFAAMEETESNPLIRVPFAALDALICGLQPGELWLLAARPGMGKTAFALQTAAMVSLEAPVLFFSLEMNAVALAQRLAVAATGIPPRAFRNKDLSLSQKDHLRAFAELSEENLHIDERPSLTPAAIVGAVHRWVALNRKTPALVVIDHIGLVQGCGDGPNANAVLGDVSMAFRNEIAKEFGCAVLLLSQLNRGLESRTDKRPVMSDLRSSGALEQNADGVIGLYRDEYYNKQTTMLQTLEAIILKNRDGECGTAKLHFDRGQISNVNETWRSHPSSGPSQP